MKMIRIDSEDATEVNVVVSNVLCYLNHCLQNCLPANIRRVAVHEFSTTDIVSAKNFLWSCSVAGLLPEYKDRRASSKRTLEEAEIDDIIEGLQILDKKEHKVRFMTDNLKDLPNYNPEQLNTVAMLRRIEDLERKYINIESTEHHNTIELSSLAEKCDEQADKLKTTNEAIATHATLIDDLQKDKDRRASAQDEGPSRDDKPQNDNNGAQMESDGSTSSATDSDLDAERSDEEEAVDGDDEFQLPSTHMRPNAWRLPPQHHRQKQQSRTKVAPSNKPKTQVIKPATASQQKGQGVKFQKKKYPSHTSSLHKSNAASLFKSSVPKRQLMPAETTTGRSTGSRVDRNGFVTPRDQWKQKQRNEKQKRVFFGNIDTQHSVEDVLDFLNTKSVTVTGLYQRSRVTANKKSFVCIMSDSSMKKLCKDKDCKGFEIRAYRESNAQI